MSAQNRTVYDDGKTVYDHEKTVHDAGKTDYDTGETAREQEKDVREAPEGISFPHENRYPRKSVLLDVYRVESNPIHGGMGSVWRVHHTGWNTDLAMKQPQPWLFADEAARQNFIGECQNWINLGLHPNIVSCYYVREIDGVPTIFSEWMENGSLENRITDGTLYDGTEEEVQARLLDIAIQYARGLHYAHEAGLIHQDVKPDNLLLTKDWQAKAADFGLAKARAVLTVREEEGDEGATHMAASGGYTPAYCSMEQMDGKPLTRRTDIYSWAVSVMEMYLGGRSWQNGVVAGMSCRDYFEDADRRTDVPKPLQELLAQCMETNPEDRPHDFALIEKELERIYSEVLGTEYSRPAPEAAADTADSLNNRALSFLDLGMPEEAEELWTRALEADPGAAIVQYNRGIRTLRRKMEDGAGGYDLFDDLAEIVNQVYMSNRGKPAAWKEELLARLCRAGYQGSPAAANLEQAVKLSRRSSERAVYEAELRELKRNWFLLPVTPGTCDKICFDTDGKICAVARSETGSQLPDGSADFLTVYDLETGAELRKKNLDNCGITSPWDRIILEGKILYLINTTTGEAFAFETRTLNRRPDLDDGEYSEHSDACAYDRDSGWPYVELPDGLRSLRQMSYVERRGNVGVTVKRTNPATLWIEKKESGRRPVGFGGPPTPTENHNGLRAVLPAIGMNSDQYAIQASFDRKWLLMFTKPYYSDQARSFSVLNIEHFGTIPEYVVSRAVSFAEASGVQREQERLLRAAESYLGKGEVKAALEALGKAYALSPDNPGTKWWELNNRAGRMPGAGRIRLRGVRQDREYREQEINTDLRSGEAYLLADHSPMAVLAGREELRRIQEAAEASLHRSEPNELTFRQEGRDCLCVSGSGRRETRLRNVRMADDAAGVLDPGSGRIYTLSEGLFSAWNADSGILLTSLRIGTEEKEPIPPLLRLSSPDRLHALKPIRIWLNLAENATLALAESEILNVYEPKGITGFIEYRLIDLQAMRVLHRHYGHPDRLVNMQEEGLTVAGTELKEISRDGDLFLWSAVSGAELWTVSGTGCFQREIVGMEAGHIRMDGNAVLCITTWSKNGNIYQQALLDWEYGLLSEMSTSEARASGEEPERIPPKTSSVRDPGATVYMLPEEDPAEREPDETIYQPQSSAAPGASKHSDTIEDLLASLERQTMEKRKSSGMMKPTPEATVYELPEPAPAKPGEAGDPLTALLEGLERKARERLKGNRNPKNK